ncbi:hypothetical protein D1157_05955 [Anaerotruncus sp. X29]|nr:hypothetical protein [Anaerotruncus sp. X29]
MTITNKSGKVIGIDGKAILPGETGAILDSYKTNGILEMLSKDPDLTIEQAEDSGEPAAAVQTEQAAPKAGKSAVQAAKADEKG